MDELGEKKLTKSWLKSNVPLCNFSGIHSSIESKILYAIDLELGMTKTLSLSWKVSILVILSLLFGATIIAFSVRSHHAGEEIAFIGKESKTLDKKFTVRPGSHLIVDTDIGQIRATGEDVQEISVAVSERGSKRSLNEFHIDINQEDNTVRIVGRYDRKFFDFLNNSNCDVRFDIRVPTDCNLSLSTAGDDVSVGNVKGDMDATTSGGDVAAESLEGNVRLRTSGGDVHLKNSEGSFVLKTSGGDIRGESIKGMIEAETSGGDITVRHSDGKLTASTSGGNIRVELKENKGIDLSTSGGDLSVSLPASIAAQVDATTVGGDIHCDFAFSGRLEDGELHGKINGGGEIIRLETSGGDIVLHQLD